jgi:hypothetical protein
MSDPKYQLSISQQRLIDTYLANAGTEYIGRKFTLTRRAKNNITCFTSGKVEFGLEISDIDLLTLAQLGYAQTYVNPPAISFTAKILVKPDTEKDSTSTTADNRPAEPHMQVLKVDIIQIYAWLIASLIAAGLSLILLVIAIRQVLNQNIPVGILSGLSTIASGFVTTIFFKNLDKANERLKRLRSESSMSRTQDRNP